VASLARPGGNVTGLSSQGTDVAQRRLGFLREVVPGLRRLAVLLDADNPSTVLETSEVQKAAHTLAIEVAAFRIRRDEDIAGAFEAFRDRAEALYCLANPITFTNRIRINTFALAARLPTIYVVREYVEAGGLMSYGPNWLRMWRRAADLVDKILHGTKPADIPVEQPTRFDLVLNLTTAKALGLKIPDKLLTIANEVIE
jgi:putative ABC transport system substrate-binding protein